MNNEGTLDKTIAHLNVQIDFLQEANHKLEAALEAETTKSQQLEAQVQELSQKQANMCSELKSIDHLAEQMEEEKAAVLAEKNKRIQDLEVVLGVVNLWDRSYSCVVSFVVVAQCRGAETVDKGTQGCCKSIERGSPVFFKCVCLCIKLFYYHVFYYQHG